MDLKSLKRLILNHSNKTIKEKKLIHKLIGDKWPEVVQKAYDESYHEGYLES